jgi:hypothetical protein
VNFTNNLLSVTTEITQQEQIFTISGSAYDELLRSPPSEQPELWITLNMYTIHEAVLTLLNGQLEAANAFGALEPIGTQIGLADFVNISPFNFSVPQNFTRTLEDLLINTTFSITQRPPLPQIAGINISSLPANYTSALANSTTYPAVYVYSSAILWEIYAVAIVFSVFSVVVGCLMILNNGVDSSMSFSQVLVTTCNKTLDQLTTGMDKGGENISDMLKNTRVRYGLIQGEEPRAAFGLDGEILHERMNK